MGVFTNIYLEFDLFLFLCEGSGNHHPKLTHTTMRFMVQIRMKVSKYQHLPIELELDLTDNLEHYFKT